MDQKKSDQGQQSSGKDNKQQDGGQNQGPQDLSGKPNQDRSKPNDSRQPADPQNPASKPYGTTRDQVNTMEGEGQAQQPGQEPSPDIHEKSVKNTEDKMTDPDYKAVKRQIDKANDDRRTTKQSKQRK